jgi:hypothetical protein
MEKLLDGLIFDLLDILMAGCVGCLMMEWLADDLPEWIEADPYRPEEMKFMLN